MAISRHVAGAVTALVLGVAVVLGLLLVVVVFLPLAPALVIWPLLKAERVEKVLELFRDWALHLAAAAAGPDDDRDGDSGRGPGPCRE